ncbi:MAG: tetratricopeptide repeat protein [Nitrospirota bacterium]
MVTSRAVLSMVAVVMLSGSAGGAFAQAQEAPQTAPVTQATVTPPAAVQPASQPAPLTQATVTQPEVAQPAPPPAPEPDLMLQGTLNFRLGNYEEALADLTKARIKDPRSAAAAYYLGATLKKMQQYTKARPHLMEAVTLQPIAKEAYLDLADVYFVLGKNDEALKALEASEREGVEPSQTAFLKGLVFMKKRGYAEAEAALEKAKSLDPKLGAAVDFQIATIYHRQGKQAEARDRFAAVAAKDPGSDVGQMAKQQADALSKRMQTGERFQATVSAQYQFDSNVILKPENAPSAASISNQSDTALVVAVRAEYAPVLQGPYSMKLQYALYQSMYQDLKAYDVQSNTFGIAPGYAFGDSSVLVPVSYNMTTVNGKDYLKAVALAPVTIFTPAEGQQAQASLRYLQKDFQYTVVLPDENRDSTDLGAVLSWYWLFAQQKGFVNAKYEINQENATGKNWSYLGNKFSVGTLYPATDVLKFALGLEAYLQSFANTNTSFNMKRQDTTVTLTVQALYRVWRNIDAQMQYVYMKDDSNIPVYAYNKNIVGIGLYAKF